MSLCHPLTDLSNSSTDGASRETPSQGRRFELSQDLCSDDSEDQEGGEGEVDGFIKERPTLSELEASERAAEREMFSDSLSSDEEGQGGRRRTSSEPSIIYSGAFLKQGVCVWMRICVLW